MGRLSYQMWRATRLVVDTGIHAKGWTQGAGGRLHEGQYRPDLDANIDAEVNRYISNPGQALAYKLGELKIRELRAQGGEGARRQVRPAPLPRRGARAGLGTAWMRSEAQIDALDRDRKSARPSRTHCHAAASAPSACICLRARLNAWLITCSRSR